MSDVNDYVFTASGLIDMPSAVAKVHALVAALQRVSRPAEVADVLERGLPPEDPATGYRFTYAVLSLAAEGLLGYAVERAPFREGLLRESAAVIPAVDPEEGAAVTFDTPYAARLHEHPEYNFSEPGTGAKYVENPAMEHARELADVIRTQMDRATKRGNP